MLSQDKRYVTEVNLSSLLCISSNGERIFLPTVYKSSKINDDGVNSLSCVRYNVIEVHSGLLETFYKVSISSIMKYDVVLHVGMFIVSIDTDKALFNINNTSNSSKDSEISLVINPFGKKSKKIEKWCCSSCNNTFIVFFTCGQNIYAINLSDGKCISVKYDLLSFEGHEKKINLSLSIISDIKCHPSKMILFLVVTFSNGNSFVLIYNYSAII